MKSVLSVGNDVDEICFKHLSDSLQAPLIFSVGDNPERSTKLRSYIRVISGGGNIGKPNKRVEFVIRFTHELPATELAKVIKDHMESEFGVRILTKQLNLPHSSFNFWLKGILIEIPEAAVKVHIVSNLMECGLRDTREKLSGKMHLHEKLVWVLEKTMEHEKKTYPNEALEWIKAHEHKFHVECCNSIAKELVAVMNTYGNSFISRWGPQAEIREMPSW